ncbi:MAG: phospholipase D-like domain-containing protein [Candidatus Paceibacterota bacterium]|jgi:cardiolipin synthase
MSYETKWTLYSDNNKAWESILADCSKAKESISLEQFIFVNDDFGKKLINVCTERASKGVEVRFLWDAAGSFTLWGSNIANELRNKGVKLLFWKTLIPGYFKIPSWRSWFLRNHRRTLVIDRKVGYTGSICVDENLKDWRDTNVRIEGGTIAKQMENAFDRMWARAEKSRPLPMKLHYRDSDFRYVTNNPSPGRRFLYRAFIKAIKNAENHIYITTPYFIPTHRMVRLLKKASERGIDVRIILPQKSDHRIVDMASRSYFTTLLESNIKIYLYQGNMIHDKIMTVDNKWASIGSMNLDRISLLYNFEANIVSADSDFAREVTKHFMDNLDQSRKVVLQEWRRRFFIKKLIEIPIKLIRKFL